MTAFETIQEVTDNRGATLRADRERGIIAGVKVLGYTSANGREYDRAAVAKAVPLYEGAAVFVDHCPPGKTRSYRERIGTLKGARIGPAGLMADLHYNPKHELAEQLAWDSEHSPGNCGLSHDVQARVSRRGGKIIIEEIAAVSSVDLVAQPATTGGLYEAIAPMERICDGPADPELRRVFDPKGYAEECDAMLRQLTHRPLQEETARFVEQVR